MTPSVSRCQGAQSNGKHTAVYRTIESHLCGQDKNNLGEK